MQFFPETRSYIESLYAFSMKLHFSLPGLPNLVRFTFFGTWWIVGQVSADQKGRLLMSTERLNNSTDRVKESRRTMLETEELGVSILQDLHQQRQSLLHAHSTVCPLISLHFVFTVILLLSLHYIIHVVHWLVIYITV